MNALSEIETHVQLQKSKAFTRNWWCFIFDIYWRLL